MCPSKYDCDTRTGYDTYISHSFSLSIGDSVHHARAHNLQRTIYEIVKVLCDHIIIISDLLFPCSLLHTSALSVDQTFAFLLRLPT